MAQHSWLNTNDDRYWRCAHCDKRARHGYGTGRDLLGDCHGKDEEREKVNGYDQMTGACFQCGSTVHGPQRGQHKNFHSNFIHRNEVVGGFAVSAVKWCDVGDHAFKAGAPGSQTLQATQTNDDGVTETNTVDVCAEHNFNLKQPKQQAIVQELQQAYPTSIPDDDLPPRKPRYMSDER